MHDNVTLLSVNAIPSAIICLISSFMVSVNQITGQPSKMVLDVAIDMEKALSDIKKDQVLEQYQFFVSESVLQKNDSLLFFREMENFYL